MNFLDVADMKGIDVAIVQVTHKWMIGEEMLFMYIDENEVPKSRKDLTSMWLIIGIPTTRISFLYLLWKLWV